MAELLVMRLIDMHRIHPAQDNTRVCGNCGAPVGIYPSGQHALRQDPTLTIICNVCAGPLPEAAVQMPAARSSEEFVREIRHSENVKKA